MSSKSLFEILIAIGLFAALILAVNLGANANGTPSSVAEAIDTGRLVGSDWIERHPTVSRLNYFSGSDWVERNPSRFYTGSDFFERHQPVAAKAVNYTGSDWIERHRPEAARAINYTGSDFYERHRPAAARAANYAGSDWIERHPTRYFDGSDYYERLVAQPTR